MINKGGGEGDMLKIMNVIKEMVDMEVLKEGIAKIFIHSIWLYESQPGSR